MKWSTGFNAIARAFFHIYMYILIGSQTEKRDEMIDWFDVHRKNENELMK